MNKTLFFGNGPNYLSDSKVTWKELIEKIKKENSFKSDKLPDTMTYEKVYLDRINNLKRENSSELILKREISDILKEQGPNSVYEKFIELNLENYITTNYDYAFTKAYRNKYVQNELEELNNETVYSLRRHKELKINGTNRKSKFWQIHGELSKPKTIMLGLDHYCGSVGKIDGYIKGNYSQKYPNIMKMSEKVKTDTYDKISWLELFFNSDIHIVGFGMEFTETDIFWILNKRVRIKNEIGLRNSVYYYVSEIENQKKQLLQSFDIKVIEIPVVKKDYIKFYDNVIDKIASS